MPVFNKTMAIANLTEAKTYALRQALDESWAAAKERRDHVGLSLLMLTELNRRSSVRTTITSIALAAIGVLLALVALFKH